MPSHAPYCRMFSHCFQFYSATPHYFNSFIFAFSSALLHYAASWNTLVFSRHYACLLGLLFSRLSHCLCRQPFAITLRYAFFAAPVIIICFACPSSFSPLSYFRFTTLRIQPLSLITFSLMISSHQALLRHARLRCHAARRLSASASIDAERTAVCRRFRQFSPLLAFFARDAATPHSCQQYSWQAAAAITPPS